MLDRKLNKIHSRQEEMVELEAQALEELDTFEDQDPLPSLAVLSTMDFSLGDELSLWDETMHPGSSGVADYSGPGPGPDASSNRLKQVVQL